MSHRFKKFLQQVSPKFYSLKFRLKILITVVLLLVIGGPLFFFVYQLDKNYRQFSDNMIETTTHAVYQSIFDDLLQNDTTAIQAQLEQFVLKPQIELLRIYKPGGKILYSSRVMEIGRDLSSLKDRVLIKRAPSGEQETFVKEGNIYSHHHPIYVQEECLPCHTNLGEAIAIMDVQVGLSDSEYIYSSIKRLMIITAILMVGILWIVLNFLYDTQIESRLQKIIAGFRELAKGNLQHKVRISGRHELALVGQKFNETVAKLKQAKEKEEQFVQENLVRADRMVTLGEVAAEIAHEVNNPAGIILTRAEILRDELQEQPGYQDYIEDLEIIIQQTEKIAETTRSILHYAQKLPQSFCQTDLNRVILQSIKILNPRIRKQKTEISFQPLTAPAMVRGNFNQLEQVFCNLINNSLDMLNASDGKIDIAIQPQQVKEQLNYRIVFHDNGPGVPDEFREEIFSPFFTTKENGKGTGLGLFIVRNIIANHNGKIYLTQNSRSGATFIIEMEAFNGSD